MKANEGAEPPSKSARDGFIFPNVSEIRQNFSTNKKFNLGKSASSFNIVNSTMYDVSGPSSFPNISVSTDYETSSGKSDSDLNLGETSWESAESSGKDSGSKSSNKSVISVRSSKYLLAIESLPSTSKGVERTKSLEDMQKMTAYGDLIMDPATTTSNIQQSGSKPKDHLYKILVIGDLGTGKTSIIKRYVHQFFSQHYRATIGVDFALKVLTWDENTLIRLQLWDIAGQERYGNMTRVYYKEAVGAFIVFDVTRKITFDSVSTWKEDLDSKVQLPNGQQIPCVLLANKCDQPKEGLVTDSSKMDEYCKEKGFLKWFETSAKENINIDKGADALIEKILENDMSLSEISKDGDQFSLTNHSKKDTKKSCSC